MNPTDLNKVIHERVRLAIMSALATRGELTFPELKEMLDLSDGNLSVHAARLEEHGLITTVKDFYAKKPRTTFIITEQGRAQFREYLAELERMLQQVKNV